MVKLIINGSDYAVKDAETAAKLADLISKECIPLDYRYDPDKKSLNDGECYFYFVAEKTVKFIIGSLAGKLWKSDEEIDDAFRKEEERIEALQQDAIEITADVPIEDI